MNPLSGAATLASPETSLAAEVHRILAASEEPLSLSRIIARLAPAHRKVDGGALLDYAYRQVAARVFYLYPRYRGRQDRFWNRPMSVHIAWLLRESLRNGPLALTEIRRRLPAYAVVQAETVLHEEVRKGRLFKHPRLGPRGSDRYWTEPPDPCRYLRGRLDAVFGDLEQLGFSREQLRASAIQLLHEEEWASCQPDAEAILVT